MTLSPFTHLPTELVLKVFADAACVSRACALALALVSSDVRRRTAPVLYETVVLSTARQVRAFVAVVATYTDADRVDEGRGGINGRADAYGEDEGSGLEKEDTKDGLSAKTRLRRSPALYVRNLCITHHALPGWSQFGANNASLATAGDPYATIFAACARLHAAALQSTFLHSSLVQSPMPTFGLGFSAVPLFTVGMSQVQPQENMSLQFRCQEILLLGPTFPGDWEMHAEACAGAARARSRSRSSSPSTSSATPSDTDVDSDTDTDANACSSILEHTTHLRLSDPLSSPHYAGQYIARLPRLTHLALRVRAGGGRVAPFAELDALLEASRARVQDGLGASDGEYDAEEYENEDTPGLRMIIVCVDPRTLTRTCYQATTKHPAELQPELDKLASLARARDERLHVIAMEGENLLQRWDGIKESIWERAARERCEREERERMRPLDV